MAHDFTENPSLVSRLLCLYFGPVLPLCSNPFVFYSDGVVCLTRGLWICVWD